MFFDIKINNGTLKHGYYFLKLKEEESKNLEGVKSYNELKVLYDNLSEYHRKLVTHKKLAMREDMELYSNLASNKIMKLVNSRKRGCFITLTFQL